MAISNGKEKRVSIVDQEILNNTLRLKRIKIESSEDLSGLPLPAESAKFIGSINDERRFNGSLRRWKKAMDMAIKS